MLMNGISLEGRGLWIVFFFGRGSCARCFCFPRNVCLFQAAWRIMWFLPSPTTYYGNCWGGSFRCWMLKHFIKASTVLPWYTGARASMNFFASVGWAGCSGVYVLRFMHYPRNMLPSWHSWYLGVRFVSCSGISAAHMHPCRHLVEFGALWQSISAAAVSVDL